MSTMMMNTSLDTNTTTTTTRTEFQATDYVINCINLIGSTYILVVLIVYQLRHQQIRHRGRAILILNGLCFLNAIAAFIHTMKDSIILYNTGIPAVVCDNLVNIAGGLPYCCGISSAFAIIWWRQRKLYSDPKLQLNMTSGCRKLNFFLIIGFLGLVVVVVVSVLLESKWEEDTVICMQVWSNKIHLVYVLSIYCIMTVACQLALLLFIIYPIFPIRRWCGGGGGKTQVDADVAVDLRKMMKRLFFCTLACCVSSLQLNIVLILITQDYITIFWPSVASLDLVITAISVICTFSTWRERLFPFGRISKHPDLSNVSKGSGSTDLHRRLSV